MKYILVILFSSLLLHAQDMRNNASYSLFSDQKASRIGDAITVVVMESATASNNSETSAGRSSSLGLSGSASYDNTSLLNGEGGLSSNNDFRGSGSTKSSGTFRTTISATIDSVLDNGNLRISGSRRISINGEEQTIDIKGIVRPSDISSDNSVLSYNISDAVIVMDGNGMIDRNQHPGWITKFFHWLF